MSVRPPRIFTSWRRKPSNSDAGIAAARVSGMQAVRFLAAAR
jgi:hypothetical protein